MIEVEKKPKAKMPRRRRFFKKSPFEPRVIADMIADCKVARPVRRLSRSVAHPEGSIQIRTVARLDFGQLDMFGNVPQPQRMVGVRGAHRTLRDDTTRYYGSDGNA